MGYPYFWKHPYIIIYGFCCLSSSRAWWQKNIRAVCIIIFYQKIIRPPQRWTMLKLINYSHKKETKKIALHPSFQEPPSELFRVVFFGGGHTAHVNNLTSPKKQSAIQRNPLRPRTRCLLLHQYLGSRFSLWSSEVFPSKNMVIQIVFDLLNDVTVVWEYGLLFLVVLFFVCLLLIFVSFCMLFWHYRYPDTCWTLVFRFVMQMPLCLNICKKQKTQHSQLTLQFRSLHL